MKGEDKLTVEVFLVIFGICVVLGWTIYSLFELSPFLAVLFCFMTLGIAIAYIIYNMAKSKEVLETEICKRLDKSGFRHEKKDGILYVYKSDSRFQIQLADSYNRRIKHLYVYYKFRGDDFGKVTNEGWSRAANAININNTDTIFVALEDHLCCCYQTSIANSKDFMKEFDHACDSIGDAMADYVRLIPYLERDYPNRAGSQANIGFKQNEQ